MKWSTDIHLKVFWVEDDLTISLAVRHWMHSTTVVEFQQLWKFLRDCLDWATDVIHSLRQKMFRDIERGAQGSYRRFVLNFASSLSWLPSRNIDVALFSLQSLVQSVQTITLDYPTETPDFLRTVLRSEPLWRAIFLGVENIPPGFNRDGTKAVFSASGRPVDLRYSALVTLVTCGRAARQKCTSESDYTPFIRVLIKAGLFATVDKIIPVCRSRDSETTFSMIYPFVEFQGFSLTTAYTDAMAHIFGSLSDCILKYPCLLPTFRHHFPRPQTLRALLDAAYSRPEHQNYVDLCSDIAVSLSSAQRRPEFMFLYPVFAWTDLEDRCVVDRVCIRHGCKNRRRGTCKDCKLAEYCGRACQKR